MATPNIVPRADSEGGLGTASKYWGSAYIDTIYVGAGKMGRDADNFFDFSTDNTVVLRLNGGNELVFNTAQIHPSVHDGLGLGYAGRGFSDLFLASGAVINFDSGNVTLTHSSGRLTFADNNKLIFGTGLDLQINHDATNSYVENFNGNLYIDNHHDDGDIIFRSDDGSGGVTTYLTLDGSLTATKFSQDAFFIDGKKMMFGNSLDLEIFHSSDSYISNNSGALYIQNLADNNDIIFRSDDGSGGVAEYLKIDGDNTRIDISKFMRFADGVEARFGAQSDLQIQHDGSNSYITQNGTGDLYIKQMTADEDLVFQCDDGAGGDATYFYLDGSSATHDGSATTALYTNWPDNSRISLGTSHDLQISHDGADSLINNYTGHLYIRNNANDKDIVFQSDDGSNAVTTYLTLDGSNPTVVFSKSAIFTDNITSYFGSGLDLQISHDGTDTHMKNYSGNFNISAHSSSGDMIFTQHGDDRDIIFKSDDGSGGTTTYFQLDGSSNIMIGYKSLYMLDDKRLYLGSAGDLELYHDATNSIIRNQNGNLTIENAHDDGDINFRCDDGSGGLATYFAIDGGIVETIFYQHSRHMDNVKAKFGDSGDLDIHHGGTNSFIQNQTGDLYIINRADDKDIKFQSDNGAGDIATYFQLDGSLATHDGSATTGLFTNWPDNSQITLGSSRDLRLYHTGTDSIIETTGTGDLYIRQSTDDKDIIFQSDDSSGGIATYFRLDGANAQTEFERNAKFLDNIKLMVGTGEDLQILHDGSHSYIHHNNTGDLEIKADVGDIKIVNYTNDKDIIFKSDDGSGGVTEYVRLDGSDASTAIKTIKVLMPNLPTSDPSVAGQLYIDASADRVLKVSAG